MAARWVPGCAAHRPDVFPYADANGNACCDLSGRRRVRSLQRRGWKVAAWDEQPLKKEARKIKKLGVDIAIISKADTKASAPRNDGRVVLP